MRPAAEAIARMSFNVRVFWYWRTTSRSSNAAVSNARSVACGLDVSGGCSTVLALAGPASAKRQQRATKMDRKRIEGPR